ncbi:MAG: hypothetical protein OSJ45_11710 [Lachnospiraceae bacterium]|nr:hypothetical protein [Lachnospiraceae bacterium]
MNGIERKLLSQEAAMQLKALKKINIWKNIAVAISTLGVALTYAGAAGTDLNIFLTIFGVIVILLGAGSAAILITGLKNGRRNVEKMLRILEEGKPYEV